MTYDLSGYTRDELLALRLSEMEGMQSAHDALTFLKGKARREAMLDIAKSEQMLALIDHALRNA